MDVNDIKRKLQNINWNFDFSISYSADSLYPFDCRKHFSYPATYIPEIPYSLVETLSNKGDIILDPFGGIGTTFIQSLILERRPYSFDINPVVTNVNEALYALFNPFLNHDKLENELLSLCENYNEYEDYSTIITDSQKNMQDWFEQETFNKVCFLMSQYNDIKDELQRSVLKMIISNILPTCSSQNKGWAYIADNVKPKIDEYKRKPVFEIYKSKTKLLFDEVAVHLKFKSDSYDDFYSETLNDKRIFCSSVTDVDIPPVDLIITSPPYPKMIDYVKSQRIAFDFLNDSFSKYVPNEIGARCRRANKNTIEKYKSSMEKINMKICNLLKQDGFLCLVLPDYSAEDSRKAVIDEMIQSYDALGLEQIFMFSRYIPSNRRTISIQWASLVNESLIIFRKKKSHHEE